jgi:hypothetical protein
MQQAVFQRLQEADMTAHMRVKTQGAFVCFGGESALAAAAG